jgi:ribosomal protein L37AE/L43A
MHHEEYMEDLRFKGATTSGLRSLLQSNMSDFGGTKLERDLNIVGRHEDRPHLSKLSARRIELYEWNLKQLDVCVCSNCGRRPLVDRPPANATTWKCDKCRSNAMLLTVH